MKLIKEKILSKSMKGIGFIALFAGDLAIKPSSTIMAKQPKCPEELLR